MSWERFWYSAMGICKIFGRIYKSRSRALLFIASILTFSLHSQQKNFFINPKDSSIQYLNHYKDLHKKFVNEVCKNDTEKKFYRLFQQNTQKGLYVPIYEEKKPDINAIKHGLPYLERKIIWLKEILTWINDSKWPMNGEEEIKELREDLANLLKIKSQYEFSKISIQKDDYEKEANSLWSKLRQSWSHLLSKIPFLKTIDFPVDYFKMRKDYEAILSSQMEDKIFKGNELYFIRKVYEDGIIDERLQNDKNLRALISMVSINLENAQGGITEDMRFDVDFVLGKINQALSKNKGEWKKYFEDWIDRAEKEQSFYQAILSLNNNKFELNGISIQDYLAEKEEARFLLQDFHYKKISETINFWVKEDPIYQAIFAIDTILTNEVPYNNNGHLEHLDVVQVVINRFYHPEFYQLQSEDPLRSYLSEESIKKVEESRWPGILFKKGEFSFTYYFIPSAIRVYCPSETKSAKRIREQNIRWAVNFLKKPNYAFEALRYYSREAMFAHIDMGGIWEDYGVIDERPGKLVSYSHRLKKLFKEQSYHYLYSFNDGPGKWYHVLKFNERNNEKIYVMSEDSQGEKFFYYRNPQHFRYFQKRSPASFQH